MGFILEMLHCSRLIYLKQKARLSGLPMSCKSSLVSGARVWCEDAVGVQYVYTPRPVLRPSQPAATISLSSGAGRYLLSLNSAM